MAFPAQAEALLRIGVAIEVPRVTLGSSGAARVLDAQGNAIAEVPAMVPLPATRNGSGVQMGTITGERLYLQPAVPDGLVFIGKNWYRGLVELVPGDQGLIAVNQVGLEDYVSSVIGSEMGHRFPTEALRSQAVASRTYALYHRNRRLQQPYDLGVGQDWQVYKGVISESNLTQAAARDTAGQVLTYQGEMIDAVFHSSSGGHTENAENVWLQAVPYLQGVPDYDVAAPVFSWTATLSAAELQSMAGDIGAVRSVEVSQRSPWGRAMQLRIVGSAGVKELTADKFRMLANLRSTMFTITPRSESATTASLLPVAADPVSFVISGRGFGHGIGMSQWGAAGLAGQGWSFQQILAHYYQGTTLSSL
jgi:stage II sporulation protein D